MPISFTVNQGKGYFTAKYSGKISLEELIHEHQAFFQTGEWHPRLNALVDLQDADFTETSNQDIDHLALYFESFLKSRSTGELRTAVYAPDDLLYGLARVYEAVTTFPALTVRVFRSFEEAKEWIEAPSENKKLV